MPATTTSSPVKAAKSGSSRRSGVTTEKPSLNGTMYIVCFAKIVDDKHDGIQLAGVHFGGAAPDYKSAEQIARDCVNNVRGGTVIPRIFNVTGHYQLLPAMNEAIARFRRLEADMVSAEEIIARSNKRK
jgi:hypothetical protein